MWGSQPPNVVTISPHLPHQPPLPRGSLLEPRTQGPLPGALLGPSWALAPLLGTPGAPSIHGQGLHSPSVS